LSKVYYVDVGATNLMAMPAERVREIRELRAEQHRKRTEMRVMLTGVRIA